MTFIDIEVFDFDAINITIVKVVVLLTAVLQFMLSIKRVIITYVSQSLICVSFSHICVWCLSIV